MKVQNIMQAEMESFLTAGDAAMIAQCVPATIIAAAKRQRLRVAARTIKGNHLFLLADVQEFARARKSAQGKRAAALEARVAGSGY